jgi:predicted transcriptional regulator
LNKVEEQQQETKETFATKNISRESASMLNLLMEQIKTLVEVSNNLNERTKEVEKRINELTVNSENPKKNLRL